ncbi:MAG: hypothetical protein ACPG7B_11010 [Pseudomonadales bacterium]
MNWLKRKSKRSLGKVGLAFTEQGLALVWADEAADTQKLKHWEVLDGQPSQLADLLEDRVERLALEGVSTSVVLGDDHYDLQLVEAPNVPLAERNQAVRFLLKDKIQIPLDDLEIQIFEVPEEAYPRAMLYAVAVSRSRLIEIRDLVLGVGLDLKQINIRELVIKALAERLSSSEEGLAVLDVRDGQARLNLLRDDTLFLCRNLNTRIDQAAMAASDWAFSFERFIVELQRSLDFFENQMSQGQVMRLLLAPVPGVTNQLIEQLNLNLVATSQILDLNELWGTGSILTARDQHDVMFAAGAIVGEKG